MFRSLCVAVPILLTFAAPALATDGVPPTPGYTLTMPATVGIGENFTICLDAPGDSVAFLLVSGNPGPLPTKFGTLDVGLPFITIWVVPMPASGEICVDHSVECDHDIIGLTAYFQFVAIGPAAGEAGISNGASLTATNSGTCDIHIGDFFGWTQGGWGAKCAGGNVACTRDAHFDDVFPNDLILGDPDGIDGDGIFALVLTSSQAVQDFLPSGSSPGALAGDELDPIDSSAGEFAGQLTAAKLNVGFDAAGLFDGMKGQTSTKLGDLVYVAGVDPSLIGKSVNFVIDLADKAISGAISEPFDVDGDSVGDITFSQLSDAVEIVNTNFDEGKVNNGNLGLP